MSEKIQKLMNDSFIARWSVLLLVALMMFFAYMFVDVMSPLKSLVESNLGWDSSVFGKYAASEFILNVCGFLIIAGVILDKLGVQGFSDRSVEMIYEALGVRNVLDFLHLTRESLETIEGFSQISADNLIEELEGMMNRSVSLSKFFGAMGIENISEKKCRRIFEYVKLDDLLSGNKKKLDEIYWELQCANGIGEKTAETFISFIKNNLDEIRELVRMFNIEKDIRFKGNFCFTGFRPDQAHVDRIRKLGFEVSEGSVTGETRALFAASIEKQSTKSKAAIKRGIPIYPAHQLDEVLDQIEAERR